MVQLYFCPFVIDSLKRKAGSSTHMAVQKTIETSEQLIIKALEFLGLKSAPKDGLDIDFHVICNFCFSTDRGGASQYW